MLEFKHVGVICRDERASRLIDSLRLIFSRASIDLTELGEERVDPAPDLVVALGGDGTVLHALALYPHTPILPINFGHVGFLTAGGEEDAEGLIMRLLDNDYLIEERIALISEFKGCRREVINEVVVKGTTKMLGVELHVDGQLIHTIRGDGAIVGTPTGSTSYLLSTGSSIVAPSVECIVVNGINEHRFASRSLILPVTSKVRLRIEESSRDPEMFLSHDGRDKIAIEIGDEVLISRAAKPARLIFFDSHAFYRNLKSRLDW